MTVEIGKQIKKFRQEQGISQQELADYLTLSRQTISKWELGKSLPDIENIVRLCDYFNISVDVLIGRKKPSFFENLFGGKERRPRLMEQDKGKKNNAAFYSAYVPEVQPLILAGQRVNTFVKVEEAIYPQITFSNLMGYANCLCSFNGEEVSIDQIGKFKLAVNIPVEKPIATFSLRDVLEINMQFGKYFRNIGGNFVTLIDIVTKDQTYYFWVESLKIAYVMWHHEKFKTIKLNLDEKFQKALELLNEEEAIEAIRNDAQNIPLFYGRESDE
ncbi:helix-turn-helix domain-containing protein [Enterococcus caccae]|uniref:HTH cro/C1-type domain-containing protein n=1 Tax=Enterococcus caccae ATCC BAA-1240 TaxID=1158612 RepID=R3W9L9_9ENTE|nr:helix-turn-helix transcriptional regulator [Enterococcus caccae]EOL44581.1 hypothetical protein UC7_02124 [Enterococcus caccae ATCC BAA-1240]EOT58724.1 hypothetical protein I580_02896 [Enterococcus caccae ATCC BAA-1240]OJG25930.1 hypothetical protein RU98_GL000807 [Enterococcus caccae]